MGDFNNTIDVLGDDVVIDSIIDGSITEFKDNVITTIGERAFSNCTALRNVDCPNVTYLNTGAFSGSGITSAYFPNVTSARSDIFEGCASLVIADFPELTDLLYYSFKGCVSLGKVNIPKLKQLSGAYIFRDASIKVLDLPELTNIGSHGPMPKLIALILRRETMVTLTQSNAFNGTPIASGTGYIYVPKALIESYKVATNWSVYANQFRTIEDYSSFLEPCTGLTLNASELIFSDIAAQMLSATIVNAPIVDDTVIWRSDDTDIAVVDVNGVVYPVCSGTTTITATCGNCSATCTVTVASGISVTNILSGVAYTSAYVTHQGNEVASSGDRVTGKIDISAYVGQSIDVKILGMTDANQMSKSHIVYYTSGNTVVSVKTGTNGNDTITSTVPNNASYARVSVNIGSGFIGIEIHHDNERIGYLPRIS